MKPLHLSVILLYLFLFTACEKELSLELHQSDVKKAEEFQKIVSDKKFQIKAYYSDIPVDYIETDDVVLQETELWGYVSEYLKDDINTFVSNNTDVTIEQNDVKMPGLDDAVLNRKYFIGVDEKGVYMKFLDYQYNPLTYRVYEMTDTYFILAIKWKQGATLYSRFDFIP
jgi:hypothetical protein